VNRVQHGYAAENYRRWRLNERGACAIIGKSQWAHAVRRSVRQIANSQSTVLIVGPSGTGKEVIAGAIHRESRRDAGPFVPVDCAAISASLFPSQLFGHVKGAFSGANCDTLGCFRAADRGTIFLDEIGELGCELQSQLLRVIQQRTVIPVGAHCGIPVDVRIIAATSRNLSREVDAGHFRLDLYYRLNVIRLTTIPLSHRPEDIEPISHGFLDRWSIENGLPRCRLSPAALDLLLAYDWPGNVRQLQNVLERIVVFADTQEITPEQVREVLVETDSVEIAEPAGDREALPSSASPSCGQCGPAGPVCCASRRNTWPKLEECESRLIRETLEHTFYNQSAAARLLAIDWRVLSRKMHKYGITVPRSQARSA
jgi:DNA-binding NtrC family response regulator